MTTENILIGKIMDYWTACIQKDMKADSEINNIIYDYAKSCSIDERKLEGDVWLTVRCMTNSQKRKLYKTMLESGIK